MELLYQQWTSLVSGSALGVGSRTTLEHLVRAEHPERTWASFLSSVRVELFTGISDPIRVSI